MPSWEDTLPSCRHLLNNIEPSVLCQITFTTVIFEHAHLDNRTESRALRAEYSIVGIPHNTAILLNLVLV